MHYNYFSYFKSYSRVRMKLLKKNQLLRPSWLLLACFHPPQQSVLSWILVNLLHWYGVLIWKSVIILSFFIGCIWCEFSFVQDDVYVLFAQFSIVLTVTLCRLSQKSIYSVLMMWTRSSQTQFSWSISSTTNWQVLSLLTFVFPSTSI